jgi:predicted GNAT family N-acyltransferase
MKGTIEVTVSPVVTEGDLLQALAIREVVFIEEQHVAEALERDADDARAFHVLATAQKHAVGTGRMVELDEPPLHEAGKWGKVGRMAVLQAYRRSKVGTRLLVALEAEGRRRGYVGVVLHAQLAALEFYRTCGYEPNGAVFEEAGIPHVEMKKKLWSATP